MPIKSRHNTRSVSEASITTGNNSPSFSAAEADALVAYIAADAAATVKLQSSPDGGSTWFDYQTLTVTGAGNWAYRITAPVPALCRFAVSGTGPVSSIKVSLWRSI